MRRKLGEYIFEVEPVRKGREWRTQIKVFEGDRIVFQDQSNLAASKSRVTFINSFSRAIGAHIPRDSMEDFLLKIQAEIEENVRRLEEAKDEPEEIEDIGQVSEKDVEDLYNNPHILKEFIEVTSRLGIAGEETLRLLVFFVFSSRILDKPVSLIVKGESSSGKSYVCQNIMRLMPPEAYFYITRASSMALYHLEEDALVHKILYVNEMAGVNEKLDYSIRSYQSENELISLVTIRDPDSGEFVVREKRIRGPMGFLVTTTSDTIHLENETRNFSVYTDETPLQTDRIKEVVTRRALGEFPEVSNDEIQLWWELQRRLKPYTVVIPYAREVFLSFPSGPLRIRRDLEHFRNLIGIITLVHQANRRKEKRGDREVIISTPADYHIAKMISQNLLSVSLYAMNPKSLQVLVTHDQLISEGKLVTAETLAKKLNWRLDTVRVALLPLIRHGYIEEVTEAGVRLLVGGLKGPRVNFLPSTEELIEKYGCKPELVYEPF